MTIDERVGRATAAGGIAAIALLVSAILDVAIWTFTFVISGRGNFAVIAYLWYSGLFIAVFLVVWWFYESYTLVASIGLKRTEYRPAIAATLLLIPIINLFFAYSLLRDLWQRTETCNSTQDPSQMRGPALVKWTVALAVLYAFGSGGLSRQPDFTSQAEAAGALLTLFGLACAAKLTMRAVVSRIAGLQRRITQQLPTPSAAP